MATADFRLLEYDDIQLVRFWRNLDHVRSQMVITHLIKRNDQRKWFEEINSDTNKYFIYTLDEKDVGCATITKIDQNKKTFEGGIFCGDASFLGHWVNIWACVKIYNFAFTNLSLNTSFATVLKKNKTALDLNQSLGYVFDEDQGENIVRLSLNRERYFMATDNMQRYLRDFVRQRV